MCRRAEGLVGGEDSCWEGTWVQKLGYVCMVDDGMGCCAEVGAWRAVEEDKGESESKRVVEEARARARERYKDI